ncbi:MAG TPA: YceI family protein [Terriglobales bacterium]
MGACLHPLVLMFALGLPALASAAGSTAIDPAKSTLVVHVGKTGLFSAFGHEHEIAAPIKRGSFSEDGLSVEFEVDSRKLHVEDKDVSDKDRQSIQERMLGPAVLDSEKFPEIRFRSTVVDRIKPDEWNVKGELTLHGQTQPVELRVQKANGRYHGIAEIRQKDFGITPTTVGGGAVKVKNELKIVFDIVGK